MVQFVVTDRGARLSQPQRVVAGRAAAAETAALRTVTDRS